MKSSIITLALLVCLSGCSSRLVTNTPRSAIEQMLLSTAVDKGLDKFHLAELADARVFLDRSNLTGVDAAYVAAAARARLCELGAVLTDDRAGVDFIVELASGALGTEYKTTLVGLPALPAPNSPVPLPEVAIWKSSRRTGIARILILVHSAGRFTAVRRCYGRADRCERSILWLPLGGRDDIRDDWRRADVECARTERRRTGAVPLPLHERAPHVRVPQR